MIDKVAYNKYISSTTWGRKRRVFIKDSQTVSGLNQCEKCEKYITGRGIHIHHKHYRNFGNETREDIEILCNKCHVAADRERTIRGKAASANALWNARVDGWTSKIYGEDWESIINPDEAEFEFEEWLEGR